MNVYLGHLSNCIQGSPSTTIGAILRDAQVAGKQAPRRLPERTVSVRLLDTTPFWLHQRARAAGRAKAEVIRAYIVDSKVSELTALYQQHTASPAEFSVALWSVMGYEPTSPPGEEVQRST